MAEPTTRTEFKAWCKRKLGYPVIDINVDDDQVDDRVDEAIQYWNTFMQNGQQRMYLKHKLTTDDVNRAKTNTKETPTALGTGAGNIATTTLVSEATSGTTSLVLADGTSFPTTGQVRIDSENINSSIFGTGKLFDEQIDEKKENIYSNIDDMLNRSLKSEEE